MTLALTKKQPVLGAMGLVAGCCIGAATLGLPVLSLVPGFIPSSFAILFSYLFTTITGLLLLEASLWFNQKTNLLTISAFTLGKAGKVTTGILFLFLFYSIFIAYMDGGGALFCSLFQLFFDMQCPYFLGVISYVSFVGIITALGIGKINKINKILVSGLLISYLAMVFIGVFYIDPQNLTHQSWKHSLNTLPILFICFGYQNLVPSLVSYLQKDIQALRKVIVLGNLIPMFFYLIWNFVILGLVSPAASPDMILVSDLLRQVTQTHVMIQLSQAFSFFALTTSFIAIGVSFIDFFNDGLQHIHIQSRTVKTLLPLFLVFIPPLVLCFIYPHVFLQALDFAGGVVDILLFGILPTLFVWSGRYIKKIESPYVLMGGKPFLLTILSICTLLLLLRIYS